MSARRRARPKERALDADPVLRARAWPGPRGARAPLDQRAPQGPERAARAGRHVLAPQQPVGARSATRPSTRGSTRHRRRGLVGARDRAAPGGGTRKSAPSPATTPCPGAIADEPGNCPCATLDYPTPQEAFTQLIATTPCHHPQPASTVPRTHRRLRLRCRAHSKRSPRLVPSSGEGRGGGPTAQPSGPVARSARFTQPAARRMAARPARRLSQRDQRTAPAAGPAGGLPHLEADTRTLRVADTSGCRLTFTV